MANKPLEGSVSDLIPPAQIKQTNILKNAVVYSANASGKPNLVKVIAFIKNVLMEAVNSTLILQLRFSL